MTLVIDDIWAFVATDEAGNEGICAFYDNEHATWLPMIGADEDRVESLRPTAEAIAEKTGRKVKLVRFERK